ncbi:DUF881 domain-containing protein [Isoptericola sp. NPDC057191]|uniref:DUF881 domain-containing protein n=1 Tax=Isoptericola sp. NPDC057191 TaxID=3346041 RepID=UPI003624EED6
MSDRTGERPDSADEGVETTPASQVPDTDPSAGGTPVGPSEVSTADAAGATAPADAVPGTEPETETETEAEAGTEARPDEAAVVDPEDAPVMAEDARGDGGPSRAADPGSADRSADETDGADGADGAADPLDVQGTQDAPGTDARETVEESVPAPSQAPTPAHAASARGEAVGAESDVLGDDDPAARDGRRPQTPAAAPAGEAGEPSGWRRLGAALRPRATRSQVLAGVLCAALGFALVVQVQQSASDQLSSARQEDLVRLLDEVTDRAQQLGDEVSDLEDTRDELRSGTGKAQSALELAEQRAESEGILSGRLPAQGPGVRVTIQDPSHQLRASQMFNVLEELRNAGAEVVELNGVRLVTSTWFEDEGDAIVVDGTALASPYEWTVIGDPETLDRALEIPGGALATVRTAGAEASTARHDRVKISAVTPPQDPRYAEPERAQG